MRMPAIAAAVLLSFSLPGQTRQLQYDGYRLPWLFMPNSAAALACGDIDGDGDLDCLVAQPDVWLGVTGLMLVRQQGGGWQQTGLASLQGPFNQPPRASLLLEDLDGDADLGTDEAS